MHYKKLPYKVLKFHTVLKGIATRNSRLVKGLAQSECATKANTGIINWSRAMQIGFIRRWLELTKKVPR
jgi:hypothetical protein